MVKQNKCTRITQSGKNCAINCAIQGVRLIWKQKIWLPICEFLWSLTNQNAWFVSSFCTELTLFFTVFEKNCTALNQSKWRNFFMCIIRKLWSLNFSKTMFKADKFDFFSFISLETKENLNINFITLIKINDDKLTIKFKVQNHCFN